MFISCHVMALIVFRIHSIFEVILSYIRGRPTPVFEHAIRQLLIPTIDQRFWSGDKQTIGLPANSSSCIKKSELNNVGLTKSQQFSYLHYNPQYGTVIQYTHY